MCAWPAEQQPSRIRRASDLSAVSVLYSDRHTVINNCFLLKVFIEEERKAFVEDYRLTACMNVLKEISENIDGSSKAIQTCFIQAL